MWWKATCSSALAATFLFSYIRLTSSSEIFNLDDAILKYATKEANVRRVKLKWVECWYNNTYMKEHLTLKPYQLHVRPGQFKLNEVNSETKQPQVVYKNIIKNDGNSPMTSIIKETRYRMETKTITTTKGLEFNITGSSTATVKGAVGIGGGFAANFMLHTTETNSNSTQKTISIEMTVIIPPRREVTIVWQVTEIQKDYNWTMDVYVTGYCALYYDRKWNGNQLQIFPIKFVGYDKSIPEITLESARHSGIVKYQTSGVMTSVETLKHNVIVTEKKISPPSKHSKILHKKGGKVAGSITPI